MSKQDLLLNALKNGRTVTHATAMTVFRIPNLTAERRARQAAHTPNSLRT